VSILVDITEISAIVVALGSGWRCLLARAPAKLPRIRARPFARTLACNPSLKPTGLKSRLFEIKQKAIS